MGKGKLGFGRIKMDGGSTCVVNRCEVVILNRVALCADPVF